MKHMRTASVSIGLGVILASLTLGQGTSSAAPVVPTTSTPNYSVDIVTSPKRIAMGAAGRRNCGKPVKARVLGPSLSDGESLTFRAELTVRNGEQHAGKPHFTYDVKMKKVTKIFPTKSSAGLRSDICGFVSGYLTTPGTYKVDLTVTAVVRSGPIAVDAAHATVSLVAKYSGQAG